MAAGNSPIGFGCTKELNSGFENGLVSPDSGGDPSDGGLRARHGIPMSSSANPASQLHFQARNRANRALSKA